MGASFANTRGSGFLVSFYENFKLLHFKISRRANNAGSGGADEQQPPIGDVGMLIG